MQAVPWPNFRSLLWLVLAVVPAAAAAVSACHWASLHRSQHVLPGCPACSIPHVPAPRPSLLTPPPPPLPPVGAHQLLRPVLAGSWHGPPVQNLLEERQGQTETMMHKAHLAVSKGCAELGRETHRSGWNEPNQTTHPESRIVAWLLQPRNMS